MSEIQDRAPEIREAAKTCATVQELSRKLGWHIQSASAANDQLNLGLQYVRKNRAGVPRPAQAVPKPTSGKGKAPAKGSSDA